MEASIESDSHLQLRYEKYKGILKEFTLMSDIFMRNVFKKQECTEHILRIIMNRMELKVIDQIIQKDYKNLQGRSAILDCVARDFEGRQFDVEVQQESEGASPKRGRYHSILAERVRELKETPEGVDYMCAAMDQIFQEGMEKGLEEGELRAKKETVVSLAEMGFPTDKIAQVVKLRIQLVQEWITEGLSLAK